MKAAASVIVLGILTSMSQGQSVTLEVVAFEGGPSPAGSEWTSFSVPVVDSLAGVGFGAREDDVGGSFVGLWRFPWGSAGTYFHRSAGLEGIGAFGLGHNGDAALSTVVPGTSKFQLQHSAVAGSPVAFAVDGQGAAGVSCLVYYDHFHQSSYVNYPSLNDGYSAFTARLNNPPCVTPPCAACFGFNYGKDHGIWVRHPNNSVTLVAREGSQAPGAASGQLFDEFAESGWMVMAVSNDGRVSTAATLKGTGITTANDTGLWGPNSANAFTMIAREGADAPGVSGGKFADFGSFVLETRPDLNSSREVAFRAWMQAGVGGVTPSDDAGIWTGIKDSTLTILAREGDAAPGSGTPVYTQDFGTPVINSEGQVAFSAVVYRPLTGWADAVLSGGQGGPVWNVAADGDAAGGTDGTFDIPTKGDVLINSTGTIVFRAMVNSPTFGQRNGLWALVPGCGYYFIAWIGQSVAIGEESFTIASIDIHLGSGNDDGRQSGLSDANVVTFRVGFMQRSGPSQAIIRAYLAPCS